ncbi:MAG: PilZ domain-containing protein [Myxococcota bacterium]
MQTHPSAANPLPVHFPPSDRRGSHREDAGTGRRRFPRIPTAAACVYQSPLQRLVVKNVDVSLRGVFLHTSQWDPVGTEAHLTLSLGGSIGRREGGWVIHADAEVVRVVDEGTRLGMGLRFTSMDDSALQRLGTFLLKTMGLQAFPHLRTRFPELFL